MSWEIDPSKKCKKVSEKMLNWVILPGTFLDVFIRHESPINVKFCKRGRAFDTGRILCKLINIPLHGAAGFKNREL